MPRSGSTWILNTVATHPGCRFVGRAFTTLLNSRWRGQLPDLGSTAGDGRGHEFSQFIHFENDEEARFLDCARRVVNGDWAIYPALNFRAPYFQRRTTRTIFQIHALMPLIELCDRELPVQTVILLRHPIPNALSALQKGWRDESEDFLAHDWFRETHLTSTQRAHAERVIKKNDPLQRHVLDWCLRWLIPMRARNTGAFPHWVMLTYENTVLEPDTTVQLLSDRLALPCTEQMRSQIRRPSGNVTRDTRPHVREKPYLLSRWREAVTRHEAEKAMSLLETFGHDMYTADSDLPSEHLCEISNHSKRFPSGIAAEASPPATGTHRDHIGTPPVVSVIHRGKHSHA